MPAVPDLLVDPTWEELIERANRCHDDLMAGRLDFTGIPEGHHFAYYGRKIHGHDADPVASRSGSGRPSASTGPGSGCSTLGRW